MVPKNVVQTFQVLLILGLIFDFLNHADAFLVGKVATLVESIVDGLADVEVVVVELEGILFHFGEIKQIINQIKKHL